jgi:hypothetical protein
MAEQKISKHELARFGRSISLLFNRATMYQVDHPYVKQSIDEFFLLVEKLLSTSSPLVFILNQEKFFIDEEPLDPRIIVNRMVAHFKKAGIQSVSFEEGLGRNELRTFLEIFVSLSKYPNAEAMKKALEAKGIQHMRINHVFFKKVTADDEVVARDALEKMTPHMAEEDQLKSKKLFIDMVLESVLGEEFEKTFTIKNILNNPTGLSKNMIEADIRSFRQSEAEDGRPGPVLFHQLQMIGDEVERGLSEEGEANLSELAAAVFDMKKQLVEGIEAQKALNITYSDEEKILDKANEITDCVLLKLVKDEYKAGKISTSRLAQILRRLVPEADELKRLLPKIKAALLEEGMPLSEYMTLVQELGKELQNEELAKILKKSSEEVGIDGEELIQQVKENPVQAAELIFLAAEIQKGTGDEKALTDLLVNYVEQLGSKLTLDIAKKDGVEGEQHLRQVITGLESNIVSRLKGMDIKDDVLERLEERLNKRMDDILEKLRSDWINTQPGSSEQAGINNLSVLQIMEQSVSENEELGEILKTVRTKVESKEIDENDFKQIYAEISKEKMRRQEQDAKKRMPLGVLKPKDFMFFIDKEVSRSKRYGTPFAALSFAVVKSKPQTRQPPEAITQQALIDEILYRLATILRDADIISQMGKNALVALLPMTMQKEGKLALRRSMKLLHAKPIEVDGIPVAVKLAGVATSFDADQMPDAKAFVKALSTELMEMTVRIKNIQDLF